MKSSLFLRAVRALESEPGTGQAYVQNELSMRYVISREQVEAELPPG
jgi:hypothetical protein